MKSSFQSVNPVLLSSSFTVNANNAGQPDFGKLSYPFRKAILIEEIRFSVYAPSNLGNPGAALFVKFQLGQHYLMRDAVPVWLLGTVMSNTQEETNVGADSVQYSHYRWRLPEPLYVEAGQVLRAYFSRGADLSTAITGDLSYAGKVLPPNHTRPKRISIPYVARWVTTLGDAVDLSNEFDLFNPFNVPLRVQRLTGRVSSSSQSGLHTQSSYSALTPAVLSSAGQPLIKMNDSWGGKMVNELTGPGDVFDILRSAWTVDTIMPPKGVYLVTASNMSAIQQVHIAVIGEREEAI